MCICIDAGFERNRFPLQAGAYWEQISGTEKSADSVASVFRAAAGRGQVKHATIAKPVFAGSRGCTV